MSHSQQQCANGTASVAQVFVVPRAFERAMTAEERMVVDGLVRRFNEAMAGHRLVVAAQAIGVLTADYCGQISARGGDAVLGLQDIASRGQEWVHAGVAARAVVGKARKHMLDVRRKRGKGVR